MSSPSTEQTSQTTTHGVSQATQYIRYLILTTQDHLKTVAQQTGSTLTYHGCDISNLKSTFETFETAISNSRFPLRGLVNCAGIGWIGASVDFPIDDARKIIDVNLVGTLVVAQAAAKLVQKHDISASFVFIASMSGYVVNKARSLQDHW